MFMNTTSKSYKRVRRHAAIRSRVAGTAEIPRLSAFRSNKFIYAQLIDDVAGATLVAGSDIKDMKGTKSERAFEVGKQLAKNAISKGIAKIVFDRGGFKYTGRIKSLAEGAREGGLKF
jgi:large subunit ribosomal protein L18